MRHSLTSASDRAQYRAMWQPAKIAVFVGLLILTVAASLYPGSEAPQLVSDKLGHFLAYAVLQLSGAAAFSGPARLWIVAAGLVAMGAGLELAQSFIPYRHASWLDMAANASGVAAGGAILAAMPGLRRTIGRPIG